MRAANGFGRARDTAQAAHFEGDLIIDQERYNEILRLLLPVRGEDEQVTYLTGMLYKQKEVFSDNRAPETAQRNIIWDDAALHQGTVIPKLDLIDQSPAA